MREVSAKQTVEREARTSRMNGRISEKNKMGVFLKRCKHRH